MKANPQIRTPFGDERLRVAGARIRAARRKQAWTGQRLVDELAKAGIKRKLNWLSQLESGRVATIARPELEAISRLLEQPLAYFAATSSPEAGQADAETAALRGTLRFVMSEIVDLRREVEGLKALLRK